jgi:hypothetical protein
MKIRMLLFACALALLAGVLPVQAAGVGQTCGGIAAIQCDAGLACQFPAGQCNTPDIGGTCVQVPETCPKQGPKVCGCNGTTYENECELLKAGAQQDRKGDCGNKGGHKAGE